MKGQRCIVLLYRCFASLCEVRRRKAVRRTSVAEFWKASYRVKEKDKSKGGLNNE